MYKSVGGYKKDFQGSKHPSSRNVRNMGTTVNLKCVGCHQQTVTEQKGE